jgi:16S rRNA (cytosine967-C5)-methyltransferase
VGIGSKPREAALQILRAVRGGATFDRALNGVVLQLSEPDRKLAHEIAAGVLRERSKLDRRIYAALSNPRKRLQPDLGDILRIGTYQITYLDRVPDYAAVQSAVELAKSACGPNIAPLVNAVLRRLSREGDPEADGTFHADDAVEHLSEETSHPDWLTTRWLNRFGVSRTQALLHHNNCPPSLVIQPMRWDTDRLRSEMEAADITVADAPMGNGLVLPTSPVRDLPGFAEGGFIVQGPAQQELLRFAAPPPGSRVWDACAAPGGKAAVLARDTQVFASDRSVERLVRLRETLARVAPHVRVAAADVRHPPFPVGAVDVVVLDAPCSATGTISKHPDARWRLSPDLIGRLARQQAGLLDGASSSLAIGGLLVYLTCSLEPEENEVQIDAFLERHSEFCRDGEDMFIFPVDSGADGGFGARLRKTA